VRQVVHDCDNDGTPDITCIDEAGGMFGSEVGIEEFTKTFMGISREF
jgi:hypothetical protein